MTESWHDVIETSWGSMGVIGGARGVRNLTLPEPSPDRAIEALSDAMSGSLPEHRPGAFETLRVKLDEYFAGARDAWDEPLDLDGASDFFRRAWRACQSIPMGETRSYGWLAEQAGRPSAARGAGQAMARNRVPILVPCHRVIGSDGGLRGFGGAGLSLKARLLELERGRTR